MVHFKLRTLCIGIEIKMTLAMLEAKKAEHAINWTFLCDRSDLNKFDSGHGRQWTNNFLLTSSGFSGKTTKDIALSLRNKSKEINKSS